MKKLSLILIACGIFAVGCSQQKSASGNAQEVLSNIADSDTETQAAESLSNENVTVSSDGVSSSQIQLKIGDYQIDVEALTDSDYILKVGSIELSSEDLNNQDSIESAIREALSEATVGTSKSSVISDEIITGFRMLIQSIFNVNLDSAEDQDATTTEDDTSDTESESSASTSWSSLFSLAVSVLQLFL